MIDDASEFTIVIRGPLRDHTVTMLQRCARLGVKLVISFWSGGDRALLDRMFGLVRELGLTVGHEQARLALRPDRQPGIAWDVPAPAAGDAQVRFIEVGPATLAGDLTDRPPYSYIGTGYPQMICALIGLERITTPRCIVLRSDEMFWDLRRVVDRCRATPKLVVSNLMFFSDRYRKFHVSDHWMAGSSAELRAVLSVSKHRVEVEDVWGHDLFAPEFLAARANSPLGDYYARGGMNFHQLLTTSLLRERGHGADPARSRALVTDNFDVIPVREFEEYAWSFATPKHRIAEFVTRLRADPAYGERHGVRPAGDSRIEFFPIRPRLTRDQALSLWLEISGHIVEIDNVQPDAVGIDSIDEL